MENNEENLNSEEQKIQEPATQTNSTPSSTPINTKTIGIVVGAILVVLALIFMFATKSPKSAVKDFVKGLDKGSASKIADSINLEGVIAINSCTEYSYIEGKTTYDFSKFDDAYEKLQKSLKDKSKEDKKTYNKAKKEILVKTLEESMKEAEIKSAKVKNIKSEKVDGSKKINKVTCDIVIKNKEGKEEKKEGVEFYTMKKGLKNYVVEYPLLGL